MVETSVPVKEAIFSRNDIVISVDELDGAISKLDRNKACCYMIKFMLNFYNFSQKV